jgi:hypothetical protein
VHIQGVPCVPVPGTGTLPKMEYPYFIAFKFLTCSIVALSVILRYKNTLMKTLILILLVNCDSHLNAQSDAMKLIYLIRYATDTMIGKT